MICLLLVLLHLETAVVVLHLVENRSLVLVKIITINIIKNKIRITIIYIASI